MKNLEIERKFLVVPDRWAKVKLPGGMHMVQGYFCAEKQKVVRIRVCNDRGFLTVKGARIGSSRPEFEYEIPVSEAKELLEMTEDFPVEKIRYRIRYRGKTWEVDVFQQLNKGLVLAEIELSDTKEIFSIPGWAGEEVTLDHRYYNAYLSKHPFTTWRNNH